MMFDQNAVRSVLSEIEPDLQPLLLALHAEEPWVHMVSDVPDVVKDLAAALPEVVTLPISSSYLEIVDLLIKVLAHLEIEAFFVAMLYLQRGTLSVEGGQGNPGWASYLHVRAIELSDEPNELMKESLAVVSRLTNILKASKIADFFLNNYSTNYARQD